jgi:hypothetical protein
MDMLQGAVVASHYKLLTEAHSALPDAPVVPYVEPKARAARTRRVVASGLHRLAEAVAPPARPAAGAYAGGPVR